MLKNIPILIFLIIPCIFIQVSDACVLDTPIENQCTDSLLENPEFEYGLKGWCYTRNVYAKKSWAGIDPLDETGKMAVMSKFGFMPSELYQPLAIETTDPFTLSIAFDYNLWSWGCTHKREIAGDDFVVRLVSNDYSFDEELLRMNFKDKRKRGPTTHGWEHYQRNFDFEIPLSLTLLFELDNFKDPLQLALAFVDNVCVSEEELTAIPIPSAVYLLLSGVAGLIGLRKRVI